MNEVEPLSTRVREAALERGGEAGRTLARLWESFTALGIGAVLILAALLVGVVYTIAVIVGRDGPITTPCEQALPYIQQIEQANGHRLGSNGVARLHVAATQLSKLALTATGDDVGALQDEAQIAGAAKVGVRLQTVQANLRIASACGWSN